LERRSKEHVPTLDVYTDGSLKLLGKARCGGWAFIVVRLNKEEYYAAGYEHSTTNQRMELIAAIKGLEYAEQNRRHNEKVIIYSDSAYLVNCYVQEWYHGWQANGWVNASKKEVANKDLWMKLIPYFDSFWYDFRKVEGHAGDYWNEQCDKLAQDQAENLKMEWRKTNG